MRDHEFALTVIVTLIIGAVLTTFVNQVVTRNLIEQDCKKMHMTIINGQTYSCNAVPVR